MDLNDYYLNEVIADQHSLLHPRLSLLKFSFYDVVSRILYATICLNLFLCLATTQKAMRLNQGQNDPRVANL